MATLLVSVAFSIGSSLIARALAPDQEVGKLDNLKLQSSQYGDMLPIPYGRKRFPGEIIWQTDLQEHKTKSSGKGGPSVTTFTYSVNFAVAVTEGPIADIPRAWANGRLIWDVNATEPMTCPFVLYVGDSTQLADPVEEAALGVGNVPGYRHTARVVFREFFLTDYGNVIPSINYEVLTRGFSGCQMEAATEVSGTESPTWGSAPNILPAMTGVSGGNFRVTSARYGGGSFGSGTPAPEMDANATYLYDADTLAPLGPDVSNGTPAVSADPWPRHLAFVVNDVTFGFIDIQYAGIGFLKMTDDSVVPLWLRVQYLVSATGANPSLCSLAAVGVDGDPAYISGIDFAFLWGVPAGLEIGATVFSSDNRSLFIFTRDPGIDAVNTVTHYYRIVNGEVASDGTVSPALGASANSILGTNSNSAGGGVSASFEPNGRYCWQYNPVRNELRMYVIDPSTGNFTYSSACGLLATDSGTYAHVGSVLAFKNGYAAVVGATSMLIASRFPAGQSLSVTLGEIVADISSRAGLAEDEIDVTELTDLVDGYGITTQSPCRDGIQPLRDAWFFDPVEEDGLIVFRHRGRSPIVTFDDDDLAARLDKDDPPVPLQTVRSQEEDLASTVSVIYVNGGADYQEGTQTDRRQTTNSQQTVALKLDIVMSDLKAKSIAQTASAEIWAQREKKKWFSSLKYSKYGPTDVCVVHDQVIRIVDKRETPTGVIEWDGVPSITSVYVQGGVASNSKGIVTTTPPSSLATDLLLLDIPLIVGSEQPYGIGAVMAPHSTGSWSGASLQKSSDGGVSYSEAAATSTRGSMGFSTDVLGDFVGGNVFDESNVVTVTLTSGDVSGVTSDAVLNGANIWLLGDEILQSKNAVLVSANTYELSGHLRGRFGTEWAMGRHAIGDRFAVLPALDVDAPSSDLMRTRLYKPVTFGATLGATTAVSFSNSGNRLKPYSPVHLGGGVDGSGNATLNWTRRTRIAGNWVDFTDVPLGETTEAYIVQIWDSTYSLCARIIPSSVQTASYLATEQVTDFGALQQTIYFTVGQLGAIGIGRQEQGSILGAGSTNDLPSSPVTPYNNPVVPPPISGTCAGSVINTNLSWFTPIRVYSGTFTTSDTWVVQFTTGASVAGSGLFAAAEFGGGPISRTATIALSPCGTALASTSGTSISFNLGSGGLAVLPNTTYYVMITTSSNGQMFADLTPNR